MKYFIFIPLLLSCNQQETQEELESRCAPVLERILDVQSIREASRKSFGITISYYKAGKVSDSVWKAEQLRWHEDEHELATAANHLYESARTSGCL